MAVVPGHGLTAWVNRLSDWGILWLGLGAAMAAAGNRFGRRAATRGLLSAGIASAVANGPVKVLARRRRPAAAPLAARLLRLRSPSSSSLPSGHTATAFAFAAGAAQEAPLVGVPLLGLASLVGFSRVHSGLHHPSDVALGAAIGVGSALATRRLWPVAPREPARVGRPYTASEVDPAPGGRGVVVVVNAAAGSGEAAAEALREELPDAKVVVVDDPDDLAAALDDAASGAGAVGVAGGDGTVNAAAALAAEHGKPLLVVPGGTLNHFAFAAGLETVADAAAAVREGHVATVDLGLIDGRAFLNTASLGSYVDLVDARERLEGRIGKWPAVVVALVRVLRHAEPVVVEVDGVRRRLWMIFVGNCRYHPSGFAPSWRECLDDGQLDVRIVDASQPWSRLRLLVAVLSGRLARSRVYEQRYVPELRLRSTGGPLRLARDGETFDAGEAVTITKAPEPLVVYVTP